MGGRSSTRLAVIAAAIPFAAEANMGTPLMWGATFHLLIGNLFIGIVEGLLLLFFAPKRKWWTCVLLMVYANYVSSWMGSMLVGGLGPVFYFAGIEHLKLAFWCVVVLAWLFTIAVESPFVWLAFCGAEHCLRRVLVASLLVQSISYAVLFAWYAGVSEASLVSVKVVEDFSSMSIPDGVRVRFLGEDDKGYVFDLKSRDRNEVDADEMKSLATNHEWRVVKVIGESGSGWKASVGFWAAQGLQCHNENTGRDFHLAFETPFSMWYIRHATQLPDGKVIFQLGKDLICIADPENNQIATVVRGRCPIVEVK